MKKDVKILHFSRNDLIKNEEVYSLQVHVHPKGRITFGELICPRNTSKKVRSLLYEEAETAAEAYIKKYWGKTW